MEKLESQNRDKYIIERLRASDAPVSGELMAGELGLSRVALWKRIEILKAWGYIVASSRRGYMMEHDDGLAAWDMSVPGDIFLHDAIPSTMDEARMQALRGAPSGSIVLASSQSAGRGRSGRTWTSPQGGLYFTLILRPALPVSYAGSLILETAGILLRCLSGNYGIKLRFRWPNDIMNGNDKLGGILLESFGAHDKPDFYLIGVGLNFKSIQVEGRGTASFDKLSLDPPRRAQLAAETTRQMQAWAAKPMLEVGRWKALLPDRRIRISVYLWDGRMISAFPESYSRKGDLDLGGDPFLINFSECAKIVYDGEIL